MKRCMTLFAKRHYIKSFFFFVAVMVIFSCWFCAEKTTSCFCRFQYTHFDCIFDSVLSFNFLLVIFAIFSRALPSCWTSLEFATFFTISYFAFFGISVYLASLIFTFFAIPTKTIFSRFVFKKFINRFYFFAFGTFFCYGWFRHGFFSLDLERLCFEPLEGRSLCGSFYNTTNLIGVK